MPVPIKRIDRLPKKPVLIIYLKETMKQGTVCDLEIEFSGSLWEYAEGFFKGSYTEQNGDKKVFLATHLRPNNARRLFPCFDEPSFKVPFIVSITRPKNYVTLFNTPVKYTEDTQLDDNYEIDFFETTPPMSTFTLGFVISQLSLLNRTATPDPELKRPCTLRIWARPDIHDELEASVSLSVLWSSQKLITVSFNVECVHKS